MASTLNLRRTVRCAVGLAVERFGEWAGISVIDGARVLRVDSAGTNHFGSDGRTQPERDLSAAARERLRSAATSPVAHPAPLTADIAEAFGVPGGAVEVLSEQGGVLLAVPLALAAIGPAVLSIAALTRPDAAEVAAFARRAARAITSATIYEERSTLAGTLRQALMPATLPDIPGVELGAAYRPAQEATQIGGDFYDVTAVDEGRWALSIGDVCGKGVDAAVLTGQVRQSLRTAGLVSSDPATVLQLVNETMVRGDGNTFVTAIYALVEPSDDHVVIRLASGGHPPPLLLHGRTVGSVAAPGTLVGILPDVSFQTAEISLDPGDVIVLYTDGAPEARGPSGLLGNDALSELLEDCGDLTAQAIADRMMQRVLEHLQGWAHDDIAIVALRCVSAGAA